MSRREVKGIFILYTDNTSEEWEFPTAAVARHIVSSRDHRDGRRNVVKKYDYHEVAWIANIQILKDKVFGEGTIKHEGASRSEVDLP